MEHRVKSCPLRRKCARPSDE